MCSASQIVWRLVNLLGTKTIDLEKEINILILMLKYQIDLVRRLRYSLDGHIFIQKMHKVINWS